MRSLKIFCLALFPVFSFSQGTNVHSIDSLAGTVIKNLNNYKKEQILLQTDKNLYGAGETIWYRAFMIDSISKKPSAKNKILFVDLVDDNDSLVNRQMLNAAAYKTDGAFQLGDSVYEGVYWLRAYTNEIINNNVNDISIKPVFVASRKKNLNTLSKDEDRNNTANEKFSFEIFPEGGAIITGMNSTIAVKATDKGKPLTGSGIVKDSRNNVVAKFSTDKKGLGKFTFSPAWYGKYSVWLQNGDNFDSVAVLPPVNFFAAQVAVNEQNEHNLNVTVALEDSLNSNDYTTYLLCISGDSLCFASVGRGMYNINIPLSNFPGGEAFLLLFNSKAELLSERDVYISKTNSHAEIIPDRGNYDPRENVKMDINITGTGAKPVQAMLSVSVVDIRVVDTTNNFAPSIEPGKADLVMLTQKGTYKNFLEYSRDHTPKEADSSYDSFILTGQLLNKKREPMSNVAVTLLSGKSDLFFLTDTTDTNGRFTFHLPPHDDTIDFSFQATNLKGIKEDADVVVDAAPDLPSFATPSKLKKKFYDNEVKQLTQKISEPGIDSLLIGSGKGWLPEVTVSAGSNKKKAKTSNGIITSEMLERGGFNNVGTAILSNGTFHLIGGFLMAGGPNAFAPSSQDEPIIVMDGLQVSVAGVNPDATESSPVLSYLKTISTDQVDYIRVLSGNDAGIYGVRSGHGVIEIHTTTKLKNYAVGKGLQALHPPGFTVAPSFEMPQYGSKETKNSKSPDLRTTIYWNGDIIADANGKATANFFTADAATTYRVTITGVTVKGDIINKTITIQRNW